jgi:histidine triad (HIT) family protein
MPEKSCIFCKIVRRESPASRVYENVRVLAFLDIRPQNDGHTLVIPKKHYETIYDLPEDEIP